MNVRLQHDYEFIAGVYWQQQLHLTQYSVSMHLVTATTDQAQIGVAMDRLRCFLEHELHDTVFINQSNADIAEMLTVLGINVTTLPEEPIDQIVGMMLYCKLNAIMEGRIVITDIDISSEMGGSVWYLHNEDEPLGPLTAQGWWHDSTPDHNNVKVEDDEEKIVKVKPNGWLEYGLTWPDESTPTASNTVVYAKFGKDDAKSLQ